MDLIPVRATGELYAALDDVARLYYAVNGKDSVDLDGEWIDMMIECIAAGSYFNTYRMLDQYVKQIWRRS